MLCRPYRARVASCRIDPQGVALGCCSVPFQGNENVARIGRSEEPVLGDRQSTSESLSRPPDVSHTPPHPVQRLVRSVIVGSLALLLGACSSTPPSATMWVREVSPAIRFEPGMAPQAAPTRVNLSGAGRETASFQFSIAVPTSAIQDVELSVSRLASSNQNTIDSAR